MQGSGGTKLRSYVDTHMCLFVRLVSCLDLLIRIGQLALLFFHQPQVLLSLRKLALKVALDLRVNYGTSVSKNYLQGTRREAYQWQR